MTITIDRPSTHRAAPPQRIWLVGAAGVALALVAAWLLLGRGPGKVPYDDPAAAGRLTLCRGTHAVTSGSSASLATTVVGTASSAAAVSLFGYQPHQGVAPSSWSGLQLAPSVSGPRVALHADDTTLAQFVAAYPAYWQGWVQLRLYRAAPGQPVAATYDALDLHLDGDHWTAVHPGHAACS